MAESTAFVRQSQGFGNAGRNILTAPGFQDVDFAASKTTAIGEALSLQFRAEVFNIFNHPNFGQPVNQVTSAQFGQILSTRTVRGDLGSSAADPVGSEADLLSGGVRRESGLAGRGSGLLKTEEVSRTQ